MIPFKWLSQTGASTYFCPRGAYVVTFLLCSPAGARLRRSPANKPSSCAQRRPDVPPPADSLLALK